ncbi:MAG: membrane protein insertase YidC [Deltaproteobacteria bacterium]|nr:membrane protein insertase YidC [Deltaproteobacteria bacterium]MBW1951506.1 membrane protein insertase YidC [Deltaproteobacteria bacterium]MBW1987425.1 membrane protein insertase YidC [Deltaproteobacteria bacterium]MBW2135495.1 membrane protein insertase YidC [Deltaproteobacteria bacterium]
MEKRLIIAVTLSVLIFLVFGYLQERFAPTPPPEEAKPVASTPAPTPAPPPSQVIEPSPAPEIPPLAPATAEPPRDIMVDTPLYHAVFTEPGARLKSFKLKKYREELPITTIAGFDLWWFNFEIQKYQPASEQHTVPKELIEISDPAQLPLAVSWESSTTPALTAVPYRASQKSLTIDSQGKGSLTFTQVRPDGLILIKTLTFRGDTYQIGLNLTVQNQSRQPSAGNLNLSLTADYAKPEVGRYSFQGFVGFINGSRQEVKSSKLEELKTFTGQIDWASLEDNYFMKAVVPGAGYESILTLQETSSKIMTATLKTAMNAIPPGQQATIPYALYFGPKELSILKSLGLGLEQAVNFGWFNILAMPLLYVLNFFYRYLHNYGVAIILLTALIRILFIYPNHKSYKSMQAMQKLQPKIAKLREKYKDDRETMNKELMGLYKTYKVNPASGCLPMLLQLPVFIALYNILGYAIEMRHAPFIPTLPFTEIVWLADLSVRDPLLITPVVMGVTMFIQQKMSPAPGDPTQAKLMLMMPVIFTVMFLNFSSGLVLYWLANNVLSIIQQHFTNKYLS